VRLADRRPIYAWTVAILLTLAQVFSFIDRQILSLLIGPIRADLGISDTGVAMLHGFAFVAFYSFIGIPLGRLADRAHRPLIIATGLVFWSLATAACGLAKNFWGLFTARMCVGIGEASLSPSALSLLADYFPKSSLGRAVGLYMGGIYVGSGLAFVVGGAVAQWAIGLGDVTLPALGTMHGWQLTFLIVGLPGVLLAAILVWVIEPRAAPAKHDVAVPIREVAGHLWTHRDLYVPHYVGFGLVTALLYGLTFWAPQTLVRTYDVTIGQAGLAFGLAMLICGPLGAYAGGALADRGVARGDLRAPLRVAGVGFALAAPAVLAFGLAPTLPLAIAACFPVAFLLGFPLGIATSTLQLMTPNRMRGQASGVYYVCVNIIGFTTGPLSIALLTEHVFGDDKALHLSVACAGAFFAPLAGLLLWSARKGYARELTVHNPNPEPVIP
jgi:MFS family permease